MKPKWKKALVFLAIVAAFVVYSAWQDTKAAHCLHPQDVIADLKEYNDPSEFGKLQIMRGQDAKLFAEQTGYPTVDAVGRMYVQWFLHAPVVAAWATDVGGCAIDTDGRTAGTEGYGLAVIPKRAVVGIYKMFGLDPEVVVSM